MDDATSIAVSESRACATTKTKEVRCWGYISDLSKEVTTSTGAVPVKGTADAVQIALGPSAMCVLHAGGKVDCRGSDVDGEDKGNYRAMKIESIPGITDAKKVVVGREGCAPRAGGKVTCWHLPPSGAADRTITAKLVFDVENAKGVVDLAYDSYGMYLLDGKGDISRFRWWYLSTNETPTAPKPIVFGSAPGATELDLRRRAADRPRRQGGSGGLRSRTIPALERRGRHAARIAQSGRRHHRRRACLRGTQHLLCAPCERCRGLLGLGHLRHAWRRDADIPRRPASRRR